MTCALCCSACGKARVALAILARGRIERFTESLDSDYDPIRRMAKTAERVAL